MSDAPLDHVRVGDELAVEFFARGHDDGVDFLDANVDIQAGVFAGSFQCDFQVSDRAEFGRQLEEVGAGESSSAELATFDGYLRMSVTTRDARGGTRVADWENSATFPAGTGPTLAWDRTQDLDELAKGARQLAGICERRQ